MRCLSYKIGNKEILNALLSTLLFVDNVFLSEVNLMRF